MNARNPEHPTAGFASSETPDSFFLSDLLAGIGSCETPLPRVRVAGVAIDSRRVLPGFVFVAIEGQKTSGNAFVKEALARGALAILSEKSPDTPSPVPWVRVSESRTALALVSARLYRHPDHSLTLFGVTGTNGKTTVTMLIQDMLNAQRSPCGLIGTVRYDLGNRSLPAHRTTPEAVELYPLLAQMLEAGCRSASIEVSSHAIAQNRVHGLRIPVGVFLNLTQDHLDYHLTMEAYFLAKRQLFMEAEAHGMTHAVINLDDSWGLRLASEIPDSLNVTGFTLRPLEDFADLKQLRPGLRFFAAHDVRHHDGGCTFSMLHPEGRLTVQSPLLGNYNVQNVLAALASLHAAGADLLMASARLATFAGVPGRMEPVSMGQPFRVVVDYAHTDNALDNALRMLRTLTSGKLLVVYGCGGNRDRRKRPLMVQAVERYADAVWITADNPRTEPLNQIFDDMRAGLSGHVPTQFITDRRHAISSALSSALAGDTVLIAGKGHETVQEFADTVQAFDDRSVARELLKVKLLATALAEGKGGGKYHA